MKFDIVLADRPHICELKHLGETTFIDTYRGRGKDRPDEMVLEYVREKFSEDVLTQEIKNPAVTYFLIRADQRFVGYAKLIAEPPPAFVQERNLMHMERLYLGKEWKGKGGGTALLRHSEEYARGKGYVGLWLGVWDENKEAIAFYLAKGYKKVGAHEWKFSYGQYYYVDTDDVMIKVFQD